MAMRRDRPWFASLCLAVAAILGVIASVPPEARAGAMASHAGGPREMREADLAKVRVFLERKIVQEKLRSYGVAPRDAFSKVAGLDDAALHLLAARTDGIPEGGSAAGVDSGTVIGILVVAFLVIALVAYLISLGVKVVANELRNKPSAGDGPSPPPSVPAPAE